MRDVSGKKFDLHFQEESPLLSAVKAKIQEEYQYNASKAIFCHAGVEIPENSKLTADFMGGDSILLMVDYSLYPEKSFPTVDNAFHFGTPRYNEFFQKSEIQTSEEAALINLVHKNENYSDPARNLLAFIHQNTNNPDISAISLNGLLSAFRRQGQGSNSPLSFEIEINRFLTNINDVRYGSDHDSLPDLDEQITEDSDQDVRFMNPDDPDDIGEYVFAHGDGDLPYLVEFDDNSHQEEEDDMREEEDIENAPLVIDLDQLQQREEIGRLMRREYEEEHQQLRELNIELTQQDEEAIDRLMQIGFDRMTIIQVYIACDRDEEATTNCLISMG